jgi:DNA-binding MarR family transcriptional regulator
MSNNPLQNNQKKLKRAVLKEELIALVGNHVQAVILNQFIYWSERTKDVDQFLEEERKRNPEAGIDLTYGWIYKSAEELTGEIMLSLSPATVRRHINKLVEVGYLDRRNNPKYKWDRCLQYRPNILKIQRELQAIGYSLEGYPLMLDDNPFCTAQNALCKMQNGSSNLQNQSVKMQNRSCENAEALPEITTEITTEITAEKEGSPDGDHAPVKEEIEKPLNAQMFEALATTCRYDIDLLTDKQRGQLNQTEKRLRKIKATPVDVLAFGEWWPVHDWRGKTGEFPQPAQVREEWGRFQHWLKQDEQMKTQALQGEKVRAERQAQEQSERAAMHPHLAEALDVWSLACEHLRVTLAREVYTLNIEPLEVLQPNGVFRLQTPNRMAHEWLEHRLRSAVERALELAKGRSVSVEFVPGAT